MERVSYMTACSCFETQHRHQSAAQSGPLAITIQHSGSGLYIAQRAFLVRMISQGLSVNVLRVSVGNERPHAHQIKPKQRARG